MPYSLQSQVIVIIGATQGIGAVTARRLCKEGATVSARNLRSATAFGALTGAFDPDQALARKPEIYVGLLQKAALGGYDAVSYFRDSRLLGLTPTRSATSAPLAALPENRVLPLAIQCSDAC